MVVYNKEMATEVLRAYVVSEDKSNPIDTAKFEQWFNSRVASHKRLRGGIRLIEQIPKNAVGKILRNILKEKARVEYDTEVRMAKGARL